jgi:charged multivesicular body protein 6
VLDREHAIAKAHLAAGRKDRAVIALRQRKYQESLLLKTDAQLENLEQLVCPVVLVWDTVLTVLLGINNRVLSCGGLCSAWPEARKRGSQGDPQRDEHRKRREADGGDTRGASIPEGDYASSPSLLILSHAQQEISDILANNLTLDEEEAVQAELRELQEAAVSDYLSLYTCNLMYVCCSLLRISQSSCPRHQRIARLL